MLEVRYNTDTNEVTGWCGDETQFGNLDRGSPNEAIVVFDIPIPENVLEAYLYDEATQTLIDNPDYTPPEENPTNYTHLTFTASGGNTATRLSAIETFLESL